MTQALLFSMQMNRNTDTISDSKKIIEKQDKKIAQLQKNLTDAHQSLNCRNTCLKYTCACCLCSCSYSALLFYMMDNKYNCKTK